MRLHEFEAVDLFEAAGIPVQRRGVARTVEEALRVAEEIGYPVMVKAQVLVGSRGLAGGVKSASTPRELRDIAAALLGTEIKGLPVRKLLLTHRADIAQELYVGIAVEGYSGRPVVVVSSSGGMHLEETVRVSPEKIVSMPLNPASGFGPAEARKLVERLTLDERLRGDWADVVVKLYGVFLQFEALIAEINPLAVLEDGTILAVDAVLEVDDSALSRIKHPLPDRLERIENPLERKGKEIGVTYVDLGGDIALISSGAGLGMASVDIIGQTMKPANFLETGGGITEELLYKCMDLVLSKPGVRGMLINVYGGINPIHEGARGVVRYINEHNVSIPIVAKALGNHQEETWEILQSAGVHVVVDPATEAAVERLRQLVT